MITALRVHPVGLVLCLWLATTGNHALGQTDSQLRYVCKQFVEKSLHDPRDADLQWTKGQVFQNKDGLYIVRFKGRAKNQFGALRLSTFECTIRHTSGDNFRAVRVRVVE